jgi:hypothetical protein
MTSPGSGRLSRYGGCGVGLFSYASIFGVVYRRILAYLVIMVYLRILVYLGITSYTSILGDI